MNPYSPPVASPAQYPGASLPYDASAPPAGAVSDLAVDLLRQTRPWVIFLSILAFVGCALMLVLGLLMTGIGLMAPGPAGAKGIQAMVGVVYLPFGFLYIYPGIKMWMYGSAIGRLMASRAPSDLEAALLQQKSFWKFSGIAAIVMIGVYILIFIGVFAVAMASGLGKI
jgi:hypothetical protein